MLWKEELCNRIHLDDGYSRYIIHLKEKLDTILDTLDKKKTLNNTKLNLRLSWNYFREVEPII